MNEELLSELMEPITRDNIDQLQLGEWIWDNHIVERIEHGRTLTCDTIHEPIGFRQVHILEDDPFLKNHSSRLFNLSDIDHRNYRWVDFEEGRFYMFKRKESKNE